MHYALEYVHHDKQKLHNKILKQTNKNEKIIKKEKSLFEEEKRKKAMNVKLQREFGIFKTQKFTENQITDIQDRIADSAMEEEKKINLCYLLK